MHLLIFGGTGPSGVLLIQQALAASHTVVIYARSPKKLPDDVTSHPSTTIIEGQLTDTDAITKAMVGVQAVLSALGPPTSQGRSYPSDKPLAHAYTVIIDAMKKNNIKRLIALGTASIKDEHDKFSLIFSALIAGVSLFAHNAYNDIVAVGDVIREQGNELVWTIVRVPILTNNSSTDVVAGYVGDGKTGTKLARAAYASFVVKELESNDWSNKAPLISSP